ncbi:FecR family protein [Pseudomonas sp. PSKL.D1]|uniref:FecR family protein n=1 Tax=Pseudomonas sp. PSKL.D1 TaxID=3029060 RepID=UPI0023815734|nr:FecR domain-containing protein [Pseudomonas sp. PSKL.D1]WDY59830.1 FecR domain-containing protein [Pseudomonas sp. PSKL.D1]
MKLDPQVLEQAADWHLRLQEEPGCRVEFDTWLASDPAHQAAWQRMQTLWGALGELPQANPAPTPPVVARRKRRWPALAAAASIAGLAVLSAPQAQLALQADYRTGSGETREVRLADGSRITLAPHSALKVDSDNPRAVELLQGQAYFKVAHDAAHPFTAQAGELSVRVLGTAFDLSLAAQHAEVALEEGSVQAESRAYPLSERLAPGQRLDFSWPSGRVERSQVAPTQVASWRTGDLFVEDMPVRELANQLQRYSGGWVIVAEPLRDKRITGVFDVRNPERAYAALAQSLGTRARQITPWVRVVGDF